MTTHDIETLIGKLRKGVVVEELPLGNIVHLAEAKAAMREAADALEALQRERDEAVKALQYARPTTTSSTYVHTSIRLTNLNEWFAYGVLAEDGGISWETYESAEKAKRDPLYRGRAKIIRLCISNMGVEEERTPSSAELFMQELRAEREALKDAQ